MSSETRPTQSTAATATPPPRRSSSPPPILLTSTLGVTSHPSPPRPDVHSAPPLAQPVSPSGERDASLFSPSLASILSAFSSDGHGDTELLKALLLAKTKEDERMAAHDLFRAEQLRAATALAQQAFWYSRQSAPFSPVSPNPAALSPTTQYAPASSYYSPSSRSPPLSPPTELPRPSLKRPLSPPSSSNLAVPTSSSAKKSRPTPAAKHEDAMAALRAKCQRNKAASALVPPPRASTLVSSIRSTSASPPLGGRNDGGSLQMLLNAARGQGEDVAVN